MTRTLQSLIQDCISLGTASTLEQLGIVKGKVDFPQIGFEKGTTERGFQR